MNYLGLLHFVLVLLLLASCGSVSERVDHADKMASVAGFQKSVIDTDKFKLLAYHHFTQPGILASVYLEGDGNAFEGRNRVSQNPTPRNPLGLKLALLDGSKNVIYLSRPCQYIPISENPDCSFDYWTIRRSAPEVIRAMNQAIDMLKTRFRFTKIRLVGYSGGGTIAAILAAQREDVFDLRTVAGNLDITSFTKIHRVTPLTGSLNPVDFAENLIFIPQVHYIGTDDNIITSAVTDSYVSALREYDPGLACIQVQKIEGATHSKGWENAWEQYWKNEIKCNRAKP